MGDPWFDRWLRDREHYSDHASPPSFDYRQPGRDDYIERVKEAERLKREVEQQAEYTKALDYAIKAALERQAAMAVPATRPFLTSTSPATLEGRFPGLVLPRDDERVQYLARVMRDFGSLTDPVLAAQLALAAMQKYYADKTD